MLQALRSGTGSWIVKILFFLLILSFGVWGIGDIFRNRGLNDPVAEVGERPITQQALDAEFRRQIAQVRPYVGDIGIAQAKAMGLLDQALQNLVTRTLIEQAAADSGILVSDDLVRQQIASFPAFRNESGQFDPERFRLALFQNNMTEAQFVETVRRDTARTLLLEPIAAGATAPDPLVEALYSTRAELRTADVVRIPYSAVQVPAPDEATLRAHYEANPEAYMAPERRSFTVLDLSPEAVADRVAVAEEDIVAAYEAAAEQFQVPERRDIVQVIAPSREAAEAVAAAAEGQPLADAAAQVEGTQAVTLEDVNRQDLVLPELAEAAFATPAGGVTQPIETPLGWVVMQVAEVTPAQTRSLEEVRPELAAGLAREEAELEVFDIANQITDMLAGGATLEEAAAQFDMPLRSIPPVDREGRTESGEPVTDFAALPSVLEAGFGLAEGEHTGVIDAEHGGFVVARLDQFIPSAQRPLEAVRDQVEADWRETRRREIAQEQAQVAAERLAAGEDPAAVAAELGGVGQRIGPIGRDAAGEPPAVRQTLFATRPGETATVETGDGVVALEVVEASPADPAAAGERLSEVAQSVEQAIANDILVQYSRALEARYAVEVNRAVVERMYPEAVP